MFRADDTRSRLHRGAALARQAAALAALPPAVAGFYLRALRSARRCGDRWTLDVATRPHELAALLRMARGRAVAVEIGTATGWTAIALALAESGRSVTTLDPVVRPERERYLQLVPAAVRARIRFVQAAGEAPPADAPVAVEFLFIDGEHGEEPTVAAFEAWRGRLAPGAVVGFHDYGDPAYPGVAAAVARLALQGTAAGRLFVWENVP